MNRLKDWVMCHPNTMAYVAVITTINFLLTLVELITGH